MKRVPVSLSDDESAMVDEMKGIWGGENRNSVIRSSIRLSYALWKKAGKSSYAIPVTIENGESFIFVA